jgi:hypothetical protein
VIASPRDGCHCQGSNCATFVYLKGEDDYRLAFAGSYASLKPMKVFMHGLPSLSGKVQVSEQAEETTVFDWTGKEFRASLCATVSQGPKQRLPRIIRHPCSQTAMRGASQ